MPTIDPTENGPYLVKELETLENAQGEALPVRKTIALCRCGQSKKKPFCDGTHAQVGFDSSRETDGALDKREDFVGAKITVHDNRGICAHMGRCTDGLPEVWRMRTEPWIDPEGADPDAIAETVRKCPSGALSYSRDGVEHRDQEREPGITVTKDGPYAVVGGVELLDTAKGEGASDEHYTLCRCGASKNKPFCDGSHWRVKFRDG